MPLSDQDLSSISSLLATALEGFWEKRVEPRFEAIDSRFDAMESRFDAMERRFDRVETILTDHSLRLTRLNGKLDQTIERVDACEKKVA